MRDVAFRHAIVDTLQYLTSTKMYGVYTPSLNGNRVQLFTLVPTRVLYCTPLSESWLLQCRCGHSNTQHGAISCVGVNHLHLALDLSGSEVVLLGVHSPCTVTSPSVPTKPVRCLWEQHAVSTVLAVHTYTPPGDAASPVWRKRPAVTTVYTVVRNSLWGGAPHRAGGACEDTVVTYCRRALCSLHSTRGCAPLIANDSVCGSTMWPTCIAHKPRSGVCGL